ncbi:MAG TPA: zf-TFIIB domain-containing protein [Dehalococcoidia bacterium]|nr:zf-TFIIB domain-containing protein [Dehalococcoidia bacterium]
MKCPACKHLMIVVEHENIELDYCLDCSGVWFDAGELELLFETMQLTESRLSLDSILTSPDARAKEKKRRCPLCGRKMKKATVGHDPEVLIDACPQGEGLWFDKGEVVQLIRQLSDKTPGSMDAQGRVINYLGEVFKVQD